MSSSTVSFEFDSVRFGNDSVEYGVGDSGFCEVFVPFGHGELRADECGSIFISVFNDLKQCEFNLLRYGLEAKIRMF